MRSAPPRRDSAPSRRPGGDSNKQLELSFADIAALFAQQHGLTVRPSGLVYAVHHVARHAAPTYDALCGSVRGRPIVTAETLSARSRRVVMRREVQASCPSSKLNPGKIVDLNALQHFGQAVSLAAPRRSRPART